MKLGEGEPRIHQDCILAREHWLHWDSALSALFGFTDILVGSSISLYSSYVELYLLSLAV